MKSKSMKTEMDWNQDILRITMEIDQKFPELTKYINEIPVKIPEKDNKRINTKNLEDYYFSLVDIVNKYSKTHTGKKTIKT